MSFHHRPSTFEWYLTTVQDLVFFTDIIVNFLTGFAQENFIVQDLNRIAIRYLKGWFVIDFLAVLPTDQIRRMVEGDDISLFKANSVLKLLRLVKVLRASDFIDYYLLEHFEVKHSLIRLGKVTVIVLYLIHLFACIWF